MCFSTSHSHVRKKKKTKKRWGKKNCVVDFRRFHVRNVQRQLLVSLRPFFPIYFPLPCNISIWTAINITRIKSVINMNRERDVHIFPLRNVNAKCVWIIENIHFHSSRSQQQRKRAVRKYTHFSGRIKLHFSNKMRSLMF